ncbi:helix-turn-helix transcriptional regulator [Amycolatopsis arida]|uniref:helix-turn-helix transcriptional regulator n=1 Tax=Amycolatopsis arida TaxID=587909 RepID=UPI001064CD2C|nr:helix-turn-helix transcriptional regulator [Amycolatopsis arida]TDX84938.1 hypothetical protein CLV69_11722 [Amycolatopsis arida]
MATQHHEIEAWLGDDHGLDDEQVRDLTRIANELDARYPDPDDEDLKTAALVAAYRLMIDDAEEVVTDFANDLFRARAAEHQALAGLRQAARTLVRVDRSARGIHSQAGFAEIVGVDRQTVRDWLGLRSPSRKTEA